MKKELKQNIEKFLENEKKYDSLLFFSHNNEDLLIFGNKEYESFENYTLTLYKVKNNEINTPVGYISLKTKGNIVDITIISVSKDYQKKGYGSLLLTSAEIYANKNNIDKITGFALTIDNKLLPEFYIKNGYQFTDKNRFYKNKQEFRTKIKTNEETLEYC